MEFSYKIKNSAKTLKVIGACFLMKTKKSWSNFSISSKNREIVSAYRFHLNLNR